MSQRPERESISYYFEINWYDINLLKINQLKYNMDIKTSKELSVAIVTNNNAWTLAITVTHHKCVLLIVAMDR